MSFFRSIKIYFKDAFYLVFRHPSAAEIRKQGFERNKVGAEATAISFNSYIGLKKYQRRLRLFFVAMFFVMIIVGFLVLVAIIMILNLFFTLFRAENNPFTLGQIFERIIEAIKFW